MRLVVHGGASNQLHCDEKQLRLACRRAGQMGRNALDGGCSAIDVVIKVLEFLEDNGLFEAGRGARENSERFVELDAAVMDGATLDVGAVGAVRGLRNPSRLASEVMKQTSHCLLVGLGAEAFARTRGMHLSYEGIGDERGAETKIDSEPRKNGESSPGAIGDTIGVLALDRRGNLAAGASSGGRAGKLPGRVGDVCMVGGGLYADNEAGAACATGQGEALMKLVISKMACDLLRNGDDPQSAAQQCMDKVRTRLGAHGGLVVMNPDGEVGVACNTKFMPMWASD